MQQADVGLGLPVQLPRRASAYDVYATRTSDALTGRDGSPAVERRRSSFRVPAPDPDDQTGSAHSAESNQVPSSSLVIDEDRRSRRRGSQLPDISALRAARSDGARASIAVPRAPEEHTADPIRRQQSVQDGEAIKIVIHDVDFDANLSSRTGSKRRVTLRRDPADKAHRTRGFGMRVVGGKAGADGRLFAYIVWTVPGGPAEKGGLQQGDKVLEWCGVSLVDRSFEEVCSVMDRTGDTADILVEHGNDLRMCDLLDEPLPGASRKNSGEALGLQLEGVDDKSPASPTRRKLPKTPEQLAREKAVSGRIQLQVGYNDEKSEVVMSVLAADDLAFRDDSGGFGNQPEAYVQFRLLPFMDGQNTVKTEVAEPTQNPIWNTTVEVGMVSGEQLMEKTVEVTLWDYRPDKEQVFLGECTVDIQKALLDDRPVWYRLEDPRQLRGSSSTRTSPRTSLVNELTQRLKKENRSLSEETQSDLEMESGSFLHPDHAYVAGSRRGSSQSEQLDVTEPYQLSKDFSRSLPGSRRSSFQSAQNAEKEADVPPPTYNKERRRSSCTQRMRDPDEILRSLKAVKGELLGRSLTISERRGSRRGKDGKGRGRKGSVAVVEKLDMGVTCSSPSDEEDKMSTKTDAKPLGPGQIQPRGYKNIIHQAELKLSLLMTKGQLEVEVICARGIEGEIPPDTYVKTYLRDGERWLQKRKTRAVRGSLEPQFRQTLRYSACDVLGRSLVVMLWEKQGGFDHNVGLGGAEVALDAVRLTTLTTGWYPLFPIQTLGSDSNDSP
ncbi:regulating synaptic membrane exocytosis protein 1-like [Nilaparvata lugens]|uniref:regulating synaptic membrane exocytosis protein 1-like n=1 Tax=Nilaparvata lugens TaxID=108931 RepID=UPI00193E4020|nr:regulating synaptic membrane exocytosis protein 1-like [Nilaparvata lugens]